MSIEQLDYEQTLQALQEFVGARVTVSITDADTEWQGATFVGPLHSATGTDLAQLIPILEGDFADETMFFIISNPEQPSVAGTFEVGTNRGGIAAFNNHGSPTAYVATPAVCTRCAEMWTDSQVEATWEGVKTLAQWKPDVMV